MPPAKKMGRPPAENPKCETLRIRVDKDVVKKLDFTASIYQDINGPYK